MKIYYKGILLKNESENKNTFKLFFSKIISSRDLIKNCKLTKAAMEELMDKIKYFKNKEITFPSIIELLNEIDFSKNVKGYNIFFEKVKDTNGNIYGKELFTGLIFPLTENKSTKYYYETTEKNEIIQELTIENINLARFEVLLCNPLVASINEVNIKKKQFKEKLDDLQMHEERIKEFFNENVFNKEITLIEDEPLEKQNEITKIMENIEFILNILKKFDVDLYIKYNNEYESLCTPNDENLYYRIPTKNDFLKLLSNIKLSLLVKKENCNNIIEYLNIIIEKYFNKILNNEINEHDININDIDNLTSMILKSKNDYDIFEQRNVIKKLSLLYILVVKENIENIDISNEESYFKENIKSILLNINALLELGIIKNNIENYSFEDTSLENVLNIIKNIEFNQISKEQIKKLVK